MIFDITIQDNDFTEELKSYFTSNTPFQYELDKLLKNQREEGISPSSTAILNQRFSSVNNLTDLFNNTSNLTKEDKELLVYELKTDLTYYILDAKFLTQDQQAYIIKHLDIKIVDSFTPKDENGEHLYVYTYMYRTPFIIIQ